MIRMSMRQKEILGMRRSVNAGPVRSLLFLLRRPGLRVDIVFGRRYWVGYVMRFGVRGLGEAVYPDLREF